MALRSFSLSGLEVGKLFLYMDRSILRELWRESNSFTNFSFPKLEAANLNVKQKHQPTERSKATNVGPIALKRLTSGWLRQ